MRHRNFLSCGSYWWDNYGKFMDAVCGIGNTLPQSYLTLGLSLKSIHNYTSNNSTTVSMSPSTHRPGVGHTRIMEMKDCINNVCICPSQENSDYNRFVFNNFYVICEIY